MANNEQPPITHAVMDRLKTFVGQQARVVYVDSEANSRRSIVGNLEEVTVFAGVLLTGPSAYSGVIRSEDPIPFIAPGSGIISIHVPPDGKEEYRNPFIDDSYSAWSADDVDAVRRQSFGDDVVKRYWPDKTRYSY